MTTLYNHPTIEGGFILETNQGNYEISNSVVKRTTMNGSGEPVQFDMMVMIALDNAKSASVDVLSTESIAILQALCEAEANS